LVAPLSERRGNDGVEYLKRPPAPIWINRLKQETKYNDAWFAESDIGTE